MNKIKFWSLYLMVILFVQMLFIVIYNIPIYKIYCELNNYYSVNYINSFIENKITIFYSSDISNNFIFTSILEYNKDIHFSFFDYFILNNFLFSQEISFSFYSFFLDFVFYNFSPYFLISNNIDLDTSSIIYIVYFNTSITNLNLVEFLSLQSHIYVYPSETYLAFFRLYNPTNYIIKGVTIYLLSPFEVNLYLYKIQCFCFDELLLYSFESVDLPILFYIDSNINNYLNFDSLFFLQIQILYLFILNSFN
jgi:cytochrome c oxidase assembly protein subunit 11